MTQGLFQIEHPDWVDSDVFSKGQPYKYIISNVAQVLEERLRENKAAMSWKCLKLSS